MFQSFNRLKMRHFCDLFIDTLSLKENNKQILSADINAGRSNTAARPEYVTYRKTLQINMGLVVTFSILYVSQFKMSL